jgi:hypothetical protein
MALVPLLLTAACGTGDREAAVAAVAQRFSAAVQDGDGSAGCALLAVATRAELEASAERLCPAALAEEELPALGAIRRVSVNGVEAQVRGAGDTVFLTRVSRGWRVVAAGCVRRDPAPYDCAVKGS